MQRGMEIGFDNGWGEARDTCSSGGYSMLEACCYKNDGHWRAHAYDSSKNRNICSKVVDLFFMKFY